MRDRLFISYRRADAAQAAGRIRDSLNELFPKRVFVDVEDIQAGEDFTTAIATNLDSAAAVLVVIGTRWLDGSATGTTLGDPTDYVTIELQSAIRIGIPVLPVLVDGAEMPRQEDVPENLHALLRSNALHIRHASFRRDLTPLVDFAYKALGIVPPTMLEKLMEGVAGNVGYASNFRYDEKARDWHATSSLAFGALTIAVAIACYGFGVRPGIDHLLIAAPSVYVSAIGWSSRAKGGRARIGLALVGLGLLISLVQTILLPPQV